MSTHRKVYRFRMCPTTAQEQALNRMAGARRWVWNWALARWKETYEATGSRSPQAALGRIDRPEAGARDGLARGGRQPGPPASPQGSAPGLHELLREACPLPRFKSRKRDPMRFRIPQRVKVDDGKVYVPKVGKVRIRQSQPVDETTKSATFRRSADGKWYVTLTVEFEMPDVPLPAPDPAQVVGIDLGLNDFATITDGRSRSLPRSSSARAQKKLRKAQRVLSRRKPGSKRKAKAKVRVARVHQKIANQRGDFLHKLTTELVGEQRRHLHRGSVAQRSCENQAGQELHGCLDGRIPASTDVQVPSGTASTSSSSIASSLRPGCVDGCGAVNAELTLSDRQWVCACGMRASSGMSPPRSTFGTKVSGSWPRGTRTSETLGEPVSDLHGGSRRRTENPPALAVGSVNVAARGSACSSSQRAIGTAVLERPVEPRRVEGGGDAGARLPARGRGPCRGGGSSRGPWPGSGRPASQDRGGGGRTSRRLPGPSP